MIDANRLRRDTSRKVFKYRDKLFELVVHSSDTKADLHARLLTCFSVANASRSLRNRHLDLEVLANIAPYLDWRGLAGI